MTSITATSLLTSAESAAKSAAATAASSSSSASSGTASSDALSSLTSNFNTFLTLLTTQLQNQDPTSPMSSDTFTSELAQFAGVEQQVKTNTNLSQLISMGQDSAVNAGTDLVGKQVLVQSSQLPLQNGAGQVQFTTSSAEPVAIAITDSSGNIVRTASVTSSAGTNSWSWDGTDNSGNTVSDGTYSVAVQAQTSDSTTTTLTTNVVGTVTAIGKDSSGNAQLTMGSDTVEMTTLQSVLTNSTSTAATTTATAAASTAASS